MQLVLKPYISQSPRFYAFIGLKVLPLSFIGLKVLTLSFTGLKVLILSYTGLKVLAFIFHRT